MAQFNIADADISKGWSSNTPANSYAQKLWHGARRNFYYRDNPSRAALLCKQIIAQFSLSEEADEARLMLHDIRVDIRKMTGAFEKEKIIQRTEQFSKTIPCPGSWITGQGAKYGIAVAVVFLPLVGVARDGVIGIAVPEIMALLVFGGLYSAYSKVRSMFR